MPEDKRTYSSTLNGDAPGIGHAQSTINSPNGWSANTEALEVDDEWVQLDLGGVMNVGGFAMQSVDGHEFVATCTVSYSRTGWDEDWHSIGVFMGNRRYIKKHIFAAPILARYVRINPKTAVNRISMRADILLAPSEKGTGFAQSEVNSALCWAPATASTSEWMQLDFGEQPKLVAGTVMQAREDDNGQITTSYTVKYSLTGEPNDWHDIPGTYSADRYGLFEATFPTAVLARHMKLYPATWEGHPCMRADAIIFPGTVVIEDTPEEERDYSSVLGDSPKGTKHAQSSLTSPVGWVPKIANAGEWMQLNLGAKAKKVAGTVVRGRDTANGDFDQYVTAYTVSYSLTGEDDDWHEITGTWPCDHSREFANLFPSAVLARYVRLTIQSWHGGPCLRAAAIIIPGTVGMAQRVTALLH